MILDCGIYIADRNVITSFILRAPHSHASPVHQYTGAKKDNFYATELPQFASLQLAEHKLNLRVLTWRAIYVWLLYIRTISYHRAAINFMSSPLHNLRACNLRQSLLQRNDKEICKCTLIICRGHAKLRLAN